MPLSSRVLLAAGLVAAAAGAVAVPADDRSVPTFEALRALGPPDGVVVSERPVFQLAFGGVAPRDARRMRFRVTLLPSDSAFEPYVFDQRERRSGWIVTSDGTAILRPPRPILDGEYRWTFAAWNGVEWIDAAERRHFRVDSVPPGPVEEIRLTRDGDAVRMVWQPVVLDEHGRAEFVTCYHVYRYAQNPDLPHVRAFEVGVVEVPEFTDRPPAEGGSILYYKIAAEDEAGNVSVRRGPETRPPE